MCRPSATKFDAEALPVIRGLSSGPAIVTCAASVPFRSSTGIALVPAPTKSRTGFTSPRSEERSETASAWPSMPDNSMRECGMEIHEFPS